MWNAPCELFTFHQKPICGHPEQQNGFKKKVCHQPSELSENIAVWQRRNSNTVDVLIAFFWEKSGSLCEGPTDGEKDKVIWRFRTF